MELAAVAEAKLIRDTGLKSFTLALVHVSISIHHQKLKNQLKLKTSTQVLGQCPLLDTQIK